MARDTPRFGLDDYEVGDRGWDHSDLVQFVDRHSIARGPVADRPTNGTYPDELYLATDEQTLYRWDGDSASWIVAIRAGLSAGEDFDGRNSSRFQNLAELSVADATIGGRPITATERVSIDVPGDFDSLQAAVDAATYLLYDTEVVVNVYEGTYNEDIVIGATLPNDVDSAEMDDASGYLKIYGRDDENGDPIPSVKSFTVLGHQGVSSPIIERFEITGPAPDWSVEDFVVAFRGCQSGVLRHATFGADVTNGVEIYTGGAKVRDVDVTNTEYAVRTKRGAFVELSDLSGDAGTRVSSNITGFVKIRGTRATAQNGSTDFGTIHNIGGLGMTCDADNDTVMFSSTDFALGQTYTFSGVSVGYPGMEMRNNRDLSTYQPDENALHLHDGSDGTARGLYWFDSVDGVWKKSDDYTVTIDPTA